MRLPQHLMESIQVEVEKIEWRRLVQANAQLSERYKAGDFSTPAVANDAQRAAYLAVRFPATYAANQRVFSEIKLRAPHAQIASLLDLGAGPGTSLLPQAKSSLHYNTARSLKPMTIGLRWEKIWRQKARCRQSASRNGSNMTCAPGSPAIRTIW